MHIRQHLPRRTALKGAVAAFLAASVLLSTGSVLAIEEPAFVVIETSGGVELRRYAPYVVAETFVDGKLGTASNQGFRRIVAYIFGANTAAGSTTDSQKIEMTAPVTVEPIAVPAKSSEKIEMTAPVTVEPVGADTADALATAQRWRIQFAMPARYSLETLPRPNDPQVVLRQEPARRQAVVVFSGLAGEERVRKATAELRAWLAAKGLEPIGPVRLARYDPPWTLPFWRRNEVMVEVAGPT
jgi:hypothetical protein